MRRESLVVTQPAQDAFRTSSLRGPQVKLNRSLVKINELFFYFLLISLFCTTHYQQRIKLFDVLLALPTLHNIMASKLAVIFTGPLKRGDKGAFCSPNGFNSDCDNSSRQKVQSPSASCSFKAAFLLCNENSNPSFLLLIFAYHGYEKIDKQTDPRFL